MTWTVDHPRRHWWRSERATVPMSWVHHPLRAAGTGLLVALLGAWAGIVTFVGPKFGYTPTSTSSWQWTTNNWLLHLLPGAAAVVGGLLIVGRASTPRARGIGWLAVALVVAAGAWLVVGPAAWALFESSNPINTGASTNTVFLYQIGANLGPGILLAVLGGMALKAGVGTPALAPAPPADRSGTGPAHDVPTETTSKEEARPKDT